MKRNPTGLRFFCTRVHLLYDAHYLLAFFGTGHYRFVVVQYVHYVLYHLVVIAHGALV